MAPVSYQTKATNGHSHGEQSNGRHSAAEILVSKKMQLIEEEPAQAANSKSHEEVFHDTHTLSAHLANKRSDQQRRDDEPIVIFDTQSNTSIAQTAKDQFAAALLRLQSNLDVSTQRLDAIESKIETLTRQQRQQNKQISAEAAKKAGSWSSALLGKGNLGTLIYLGWPVLVFFAMRALERRSMSLKKIA